jgi:hypothetical protein
MADDLGGQTPVSTPSFRAVTSAIVAEHLEQVNVSLPGRVVSYDSSTGRASVQPLVKRGYRDDAGQRQVERLPIVPSVPVVFPGVAGGWIKFPVSAGDQGLLVVASAALDRWKASGEEVDPGDDRRHALADCVFIPGVMHDHGDASPAIEFTGGEIHAGGSDALVKRSEFMAHVHTSASSGNPTSTPTVSITGTSVLKGA